MPSRLSPSGFKPLADTAIFTPVQLGSLKLNHRIIQAPLTRMRGVKESEGVWGPGDIAVEYYSQRANKGGLQLTEATNISLLASGYPGIPGVFTPAQIAGWKRVTDAVHAKGGFIYCQIWHVGRASSSKLLGGKQTVSSSDIPIKGNAVDGTDYAADPPRPMTVEEIQEIVKDFGAAAKKCIEAGFDGVEIHGANGYLLEQFLHDNVNKRTDAYGGSVENRCRFPLEVIKSVTSAIGADKVGIRLSPYNYFQDTKDSNPNVHWAYLCNQIATLPSENQMAYVHMVEPRFDEVLDEQGKMDALAAYSKDPTEGVEAEVTAKAGINSLVPFQRILAKGGVKFLAAGNFDRDNMETKIASGDADAIVMGRLFIANPDLPKRLAEGLPLNKYDRTTFYGADPPTKGYTDYPAYEAEVAA
ncbi:12-oxophytodienoate reductase 1 [Mollisia scopiformis]|uniref:12-oxophytodienoate reductase 1 n=1 Tax=Mollisia scopiformis TaxID=149040 RepID=A0A194XCM1_MOLSC|nr:12-oxophytodienoate reductase 1 [Mollisia scopiformis]KUJ17909.1 12-oxophytodienoate reductase 1 [Mollisia scopiformis]